MRRTPSRTTTPSTIAQFLDAIQLTQRAAREDILAARASLELAEAACLRADALVIATAELLGLEVEK